METAHSLKITEKFHRCDGRSFELTTEHGWLETVYSPETGRYLLANIQSERSRRGIGKFLLRASIEHAQTLNAEYMNAFIISRECLDSMTTVFGSEHLEVDELGPYMNGTDAEFGETCASLYYPLDERLR